MRLTANKLIAAAALAIAPVAASASTITATFDQGASNYTNAQMSLNSGGSWQTVGAGMLAFDITASDIVGLTGQTIYSWCIEPTEYVLYSGTYTVGPVSSGNTALGGMGTTKANLVNELFARYLPVFSAGATLQVAQALQLAVWEIVAETSGTYNVSTGTARFVGYDASVIPLAQSYINAVTPTGGPLLSNLFAMYRIGNQDQLIQLPGGGTAVPEPGALGILGLGLLGAAIARRRRKA